MTIPGRTFLACAALFAAMIALFPAATALSGPAGPVLPAGRDQEAVREAVQAYFDGMMRGDRELLAKAFHPRARLLGSGEDGLLVIEFETWSESVPRWAPGADAEGYENRILLVDIAGDAASAKTDLAWPDVHYVDYLSLLRIDGEWKIVNKIWMEEEPRGTPGT